MKLSDIVYKCGQCFVLKVKKGYEVYKPQGACASERCATIGFGHSQYGLNRAIKECDRRAAIEAQHLLNKTIRL